MRCDICHLPLHRTPSEFSNHGATCTLCLEQIHYSKSASIHVAVPGLQDGYGETIVSVHDERVLYRLYQEQEKQREEVARRKRELEKDLAVVWLMAKAGEGARGRRRKKELAVFMGLGQEKVETEENYIPPTASLKNTKGEKGIDGSHKKELEVLERGNSRGRPDSPTVPDILELKV